MGMKKKVRGRFRGMYLKGRRFEYRVKRILSRCGLVLRSAGSHGFADLILITPKDCFFFQLSCKYEKRKLWELGKLLLEYPTLVGRLFYIYRDGKGKVMVSEVGLGCVVLYTSGLFEFCDIVQKEGVFRACEVSVH